MDTDRKSTVPGIGSLHPVAIRAVYIKVKRMVYLLDRSDFELGRIFGSTSLGCAEKENFEPPERDFEPPDTKIGSPYLSYI